jgi:ribosome maturation factor RimP
MPIDGRRRFHGFIAEEKDGVISMDLKDGSKADLSFLSMVKAHLVMTDALIEEAQRRGQAPELDPDADDHAFDEFEDEGDTFADTPDNEDNRGAES